MISQEILQPYLYGHKRHEAHDQTCKFYKELRKHANGEYPTEEIQSRRPGEGEKIHKYREKIMVAITKGEGVGLVINALGKIRRSSDWMVKFDVKNFPAKIKQGETPEDYFNFKYPGFDSITNWCFSVLLKEYLIDANAVILVAPLNEVKSTADYIQPVTRIFNSDRIYELNDEFALLKSNEKSFYNPSSGKWQGDVFYVVTAKDIQRLAQNNENVYIQTQIIQNKLGYLPLVRTPGIYFDSIGGKEIFESRIQAMIPRLTEFVREYNDNQAEVVQHVFSEKYSFVQQDCKKCESTGRVRKGDKNILCPECKGSGKILTSPYNATYAMRLAKTNLGEQPVPVPPVGYIQKSTEIVKIQDERTEKHLYKAFCAIAMQHLFQMPLNTSGYKKELDLDESITTVHNIAEDLVRILDKIIKISVDWRYMDLVPSEEERKKLLPSIPVPQKFDIISTNYLMEEVQKAREGKLNPVIITALEKEIAAKKFYTNPEMKDEVLAVMELDPLPGYSSDEKMVILSNGGTTQLDYIISSNISQFVKRATREETDFLKKEFKDKRTILEKYAQEIQDAEKEEMIEPEPSTNGITIPNSEGN